MSSCTDSPRVEGGGEEEQNVYLACILLDENPSLQDLVQHFQPNST